MRLIPDRDDTPAPLMPPDDPRSGRPLDMSHCLLRSVSPIHVEYMRNMGVAASMSLSLLREGRLWGADRLAPPDPALVDVDLNGEPSFALAERLEHQGVPFLFATGYDPALVLPEGFRAAPVLAKPYRGADATAALARLLGLI